MDTEKQIDNLWQKAPTVLITVILGGVMIWGVSLVATQIRANIIEDTELTVDVLRDYVADKDRRIIYLECQMELGTKATVKEQTDCMKERLALLPKSRSEK